LTAVAGGPVLVLALGAPFARAATPILPSGASIAAGQALVTAPGEASLRIMQSSQKVIINWQSFSIGTGANVTFQQPNNAAILLNRVVGTEISTIKGDLFANGQVWLINGNGILFGPGSRIDVGGLIATTSDMRDADFLAGRYDFGIASRNPDAAVVNQGSIKAATGGSAVLSGARVVNDGVIEANLGKVVLAGANGFSVDFDGDNLIRFEIAAPVSETPRGANGEPAPALVSNSGTIAAQGGKILLTARAARSVVNNVINSTGIVEANSASMQNGEIVFDAGDGGTASVSGSLKAAGRNAGETGGAIALRGDVVTVADGANLDASGDSGGGRVLIGGNLHGAGPEPNARAVSVGAAVIAADAGANGNGGTVAIYSAGATNVAGSISAKGGAKGGDGGTVETSGHGLQVAESTRVDTSAPAGATGSWLLDPLNINVLGEVSQQLVGGTDALDTNPTGTDSISPGTIGSRHVQCQAGSKQRHHGLCSRQLQQRQFADVLGQAQCHVQCERTKWRRRRGSRCRELGRGDGCGQHPQHARSLWQPCWYRADRWGQRPWSRRGGKLAWNHHSCGPRSRIGGREWFRRARL
jgi:filamentous hemagglutinin family protein